MELDEEDLFLQQQIHDFNDGNKSDDSYLE